MICIIYYVFVKFAHSLSFSLSLSLSLLRKEKLLFHTWCTRVNIYFTVITGYLGISAFFHFMFSNCLPKIDTLIRRTFTIYYSLYKLSINFQKIFPLYSFQNALNTNSNVTQIPTQKNQWSCRGGGCVW